jgi:hypothetical protein
LGSPENSRFVAAEAARIDNRWGELVGTTEVVPFMEHADAVIIFDPPFCNPHIF